MKENKPATNLIWTFVSIAESRSFQRWAQKIEDETLRLSLPTDNGLMLKSILLVEMSQRSIIWRAIERTIDLALAVLRIPRCLTLGPFQMRHASFRSKVQITQAMRLLISMPYSGEGDRISDTARFWNGSAECQPGASMSYTEALLLAIKVLSVSTPCGKQQSY